MSASRTSPKAGAMMLHSLRPTGFYQTDYTENKRVNRSLRSGPYLETHVKKGY